jgi:hypothetical protein
MTNKSLSEFAEESLEDSFLREIFQDLMGKYKDESERQHVIRSIISIFEKKYRVEMREFQKIMDKKRELVANEFASDEGDQQMRDVFKFPESLWQRLTMIIEKPEFLAQSNPMTKEESDEWAWFIKNFPQYVIPKKI